MRGRATLAYDKDRGYLPAVLKLLGIPVSSQTLVFSKTSFQFTRISADHPGRSTTTTTSMSARCIREKRWS